MGDEVSRAEHVVETEFAGAVAGGASASEVAEQALTAATAMSVFRNLTLLRCYSNVRGTAAAGDSGQLPALAAAELTADLNL